MMKRTKLRNWRTYRLKNRRITIGETKNGTIGILSKYLVEGGGQKIVKEQAFHFSRESAVTIAIHLMEVLQPEIEAELNKLMEVGG